MFAAEGLVQRPPAQHGALYPRRHVGHVTQSAGLLQLVDLILRGLAADHLLEQLAEAERLILRASDDHAQHDVRLSKNMPRQATTIWAAAVDEELTSRSYIVPGIGDAGDLAYGEKI